ncbi:hypothetical protein ABH926_001234 [Catenulispora sp. GP43]|uniref:hypothetical protein n=1 Tax=Catenulispora sp. GP43 TaxID=3156263 RepID=UPI003512191B
MSADPDAITADAIAAWCRLHLGSAPAETLFTTGNLARVFGMRLLDGREVVVIVGVAAAMWPADAGCAGASLEQSRDFLDAYQRARGRRFTDGEVQQTWAAGLWIRAFNAEKFFLDGFETLTATEAEKRLRWATGS